MRSVIYALKPVSTTISIIDTGGSVNSPIVLLSNPSQRLEAVPKRYVDNLLNSLPWGNFVGGFIPPAVLPGFSGGDITSAAGSTTLTLANSGVTPGSYAVTTVNSKGIITAGRKLSNQEIPIGLNWTIVTTGKPTTISGYGITDALKTSGGVINGKLSILTTPVTSNNPVNKDYVDTVVSTSKVSPGDIIRKTTTVTPAGYLRCNGAVLNRTTYTNLFSAISTTYNTFTQPGNGKPWQLQNDINTTFIGEIGPWTINTAVPIVVRSCDIVIFKNKALLVGGYDGVTSLSSVYIATVYQDGTLGPWTFESNLPIPIADVSVVVTKNRIYSIGGVTGSGADTTATVCYRVINSDGTLGNWVVDTPLPITIANSSNIIINNNIYIIGGSTGAGLRYTPSNTIYTATIDSNGVIGPWSLSPIQLPVTMANGVCVTIKNRLYYIGGILNGVTSNAIYSTTINADGTLGNWSNVGSIPITLKYAQVYITKYRVYLFGGYNGATGYTNSIYTAPINIDGTIGSWSLSKYTIPVALGSNSVIVTSSNIYLIAGFNNGGTYNYVFSAPLSGGLNDYSSYYDGTITAQSATDFKLPDTSNTDEYGYYSYIKY